MIAKTFFTNRFPHLVVAGVTLFLALIVFPAQAAGGICLSVGASIGSHVFNPATGKLSSPDVSGLSEQDRTDMQRGDVYWHGSKAAFFTNREGQWFLKVVNLKLHQLQTVLLKIDFSFPAYVSEFTFLGWSADGNYLAVERKASNYHTFTLYAASTLSPVLGRTWQVPHDGEQGRDDSPGWSPTGHYFVKSFTLPNGNRQIAIWSPDIPSRVFEWPHPQRYGGGNYLTYHWSPDGQYLAVNDDYTLRLIKMDGKAYLTDGVIEQVSNDRVTSRRSLLAWPNSPIWTPNGKTLLYITAAPISKMPCPGTDLIAFTPATSAQKIVIDNFYTPIGYSWDFRYAVMVFTDSDIPCTGGGAPTFPVTYRIADLQQGKLSPVIYSNDFNVLYPIYQWSPDSKWVVVIHYDKLVLASADGTIHHAFDADTDPTGWGPRIEWSANGEWLTYLTITRTSKNSIVPVFEGWKANAQTGEVTKLNVLNPVGLWPSLDGKVVAAVTKDENNRYGLYLITNTRTTSLSASIHYQDEVVPAYRYEPVWSSDGTLLAYISSDSPDQFALHLVKPDGSEISNVRLPSLGREPLKWIPCVS